MVAIDDVVSSRVVWVEVARGGGCYHRKFK